MTPIELGLVISVGLCLWPSGPAASPTMILVAVGYRTGDVFPFRVDRRSIVLAAMGVAVGIGVSIPLGLTIAVVVPGLRRFKRRRAAQRERSALAAALPESIDLCTVVLGAGGTIRDCLDALASHGPTPVRPSAEEAVARVGSGHRLDQALRWLQLELGPAFQPLSGSMLLAREQGGSIGVLLARLSVEANASRRRIGELRARRLPVALLIPLVVCSLPAVIVGTVVPLAIVALSGIEL